MATSGLGSSWSPRCLLQLARTCTVLYLVGFPLSTLTTLPHSVVVVASGVLIGLYTIVGGLTAVVLTDVVQGATLVCGGALTRPMPVSRRPHHCPWMMKTAMSPISRPGPAAPTSCSAPRLVQ